MKPEKCPVCLGKGFVQEGFYSTYGRTFTTTNISAEKCRSCAGKGYILVKEHKHFMDDVRACFGRGSTPVTK